MEKKYELTEETMTITVDRCEGSKVVLHRIKALKDFGSTKAGDFGGWIESEKNLSQNDNCWVSGNAMVFDDAMVIDNAIVEGGAKIYGTSCVRDNSCVSGSAVVFDDAEIRCDAHVHSYATICGNAIVKGYVTGDAFIFGNAYIFEGVTLGGDACIASNRDYFTVCGSVDVEESLSIVTFFKTRYDSTIKVCFSDHACCVINEFKEVLEDLRGEKKFGIFAYNKYINITNMAEKLLSDNGVRNFK